MDSAFGAEGSEGYGKKVLRIDRPLAGGFLGLTALRAEGCGLPLAMLIKSALRDLLFCVIGLEKHYIDQPPPVAFPPLVPHGTKGGISFARQGGWPVFPRPQGGCKGFIQTGAFYNLKAPYLASAAILYTSRGREPSTRL